MTHTLITLSRHSHQYREFTIVRHPKTAVNPIVHYHLWLDNNSFGKVDTLEQATSYIDWLHKMKKGECLSHDLHQ